MANWWSYRNHFGTGGDGSGTPRTVPNRSTETKKEMKMKRRFRQFHYSGRKVAVCLMFGLTLTTFSACGKLKTAEAPALLTPISLTDSYRPVSRRDIGEVNVESGLVVPETYPVFSEQGFSVYEIKVYPGDHVKKGDVIATGDTRALDESISELNRTLEILTLQRNTAESVSKKREQQMGYRKKAASEVGFTDEAARYDTEIKLEQENRRYSLANTDASIASVRKQLDELKKTKAKLTFTAPHDGYVTFVKDISSTNWVGANENIAVISDYDDLYIRIEGSDTKSFKFSNYQEQYILVDGKKHPIKEYSYTATELSFAQEQGSYPPVRYRAEGVSFEVGAKVPLYFSKTSCTDVIAISNDSIYSEGDFSYCYVLGADGQRERRDIEIGERDSQYTHVLSGLIEGESVFYDSNSVQPVNYREYKIEPRDYVEEYQSQYISELLTDHDIYVSEYDGSVLEANVSSLDTVEKGQELLKIEIPVMRGELADAKNQVSDAAEDYAAGKKAMDAQEKELKEEIAAAKRGDYIPEEPEKPEPRNPRRVGNVDAGKAVDVGNATVNANALKANEDNKVTTVVNDSSDVNDDNAVTTTVNVTEPNTNDVNTENNTDDKNNDNTIDNKTNNIADTTTENTDTDTPENTEDSADPDAYAQYEEDYQKYLEDLRDSKYMAECLTLDLEILQLERTLTDKQYSVTKAQLEQEVRRLSGSGTNGETVVKARTSGDLGQNIPAVTSPVYSGGYLFTISSSGKKLLRVSMPKNRGQDPLPAAKPGQTVVIKAGDKTYTGKCVAANAESVGYLFTRDGKVHFTYSTSYSAGSSEQCFVELEDTSFFDDIPSSAVASFQGCVVHGGTPVPAKAIYTETDTVSQEKKNFVWVVTENGLVKESVTLMANTKYADERLILSGIKPGDVIAVEK